MHGLLENTNKMAYRKFYPAKILTVGLLSNAKRQNHIKELVNMHRLLANMTYLGAQ